MKSTYRSVKFIHYTDSDREIISKICPIKNSTDFHARGTHSISSACASVARSHRNLYAVLRCNEWKYFITLTFGHDDRLDDSSCRKLFTKWQKMMKLQFPRMYYIAVPEYHAKGGLHYHIVVGGVTADELGLVDSGRVLHYGRSWKKEDFDDAGFEVDITTGEGLPIFNVEKWGVGFSTCTEVRDSTAVSRYISKYLTKNSIDPRFFNKRRFHTSHNVIKPKVFTKIMLTQSINVDNLPDLLGVDVAYHSSKFGIRKYDNCGICIDDVIHFGRLPDVDLPFDPHG